MINDKEKEGVVLLGFPRSGTTLLRRLLNAHSQLDAPGESYLLASCARFLQGDRVADGVAAGVLGGMGLLGFSSEEIHTRLRQLVFELRRKHALAVGKPRWVEKTAIDIFYLEEIWNLLKQRVNYVLVVRHGLDVCLSAQEWCQRIESYPRELHHYVVQHPQPLVAFAHAWVDRMQELHRFAEKQGLDVFILRYENLVAEPAGVVTHLLDYLGEKYEDGMIERALADRSIGGFGDWKVHTRRQIDSTSTERWRTLSRGTLHQLAAIVNPTLALWGYDPVEVRVSDDPEDALRRYELGLLLHSAEKRPQPHIGYAHHTPQAEAREIG